LRAFLTTSRLRVFFRQKDRMCRMTDVYLIVFHCVSFMFFCSCVFIFDKST
jgi:hypothetical protein